MRAVEEFAENWRNACLTNLRLNLTLTNSAHQRSCSLLFPTAIANGRKAIRATFVVTKSNRCQTATEIDRQTRFLKYNRSNEAILPSAATVNYQTALSIIQCGRAINPWKRATAITFTVPTDPSQMRPPTWNLRKHTSGRFPRFSSFIFVWLVNRCACGRPRSFRFCSVGKRLWFPVQLTRRYV